MRRFAGGIGVSIAAFQAVDPVLIPTQPNGPILGFPCGSSGRESACNVGDLGLLPGLGRSPGEGKGHSLQYSGLESPMDTTERLSHFTLV